MLTFIVVFQSVDVRLDKRVMVFSAESFDEAYCVARSNRKNLYPNYFIKSISQS